MGHSYHSHVRERSRQRLYHVPCKIGGAILLFVDLDFVGLGRHVWAAAWRSRRGRGGVGWSCCLESGGRLGKIGRRGYLNHRTESGKMGRSEG